MDLKNYKGVLHGDQVQEMFEAAKKHQFALPAVNIIGTNSINAVMETAAAVKSPVIIQVSHGGAQFYAGKSLDNSKLTCSKQNQMGHPGITGNVTYPGIYPKTSTFIPTCTSC